MKSNIKLIASFITLFFSFGIDISAQYNKVYWVHGLNDNNRFNWYVYEQALVAVRNQGTSIQWSSKYSLRSASDNLNYYIGEEVSYNKKAIVFGHSAGGLVARNAALMPDSKIRAVITAGTPNKGAGIVASIKSGKITNVVDKAMNMVKANLIISTNAIALIFPGISTSLLASINLVELGLTRNVHVEVQNIIKEILKDYSSPAVDDMDPSDRNNAFLKNLNDTSPTIPIINIYGNEDANRFVRLIGSALNKTKIDNYHDTTDKTYDEAKFPFYNGIVTGLAVIEGLHYGTGVAMSGLGFLNPWFWAPAGLNFAAAASWTVTRRYIQYDIHNDWDSIIGATHIDRVENWHRFLWWKWCDVKYVTVYENSDGLVPNKSSIMDQKQGPYTRNIEVRGVNHLEMCRHPNMKLKLNEILNGKIYDEAFNPKNN